ncbi:hypothetical protein ACFYXS_34670 [Streptomyces sp. NPDC002574]|uniref:hypothetical protein n=1 Tax=Streptomyces sp. NPDC002574 TaxID=3364652 RepID=UPI0036951BE5
MNDETILPGTPDTAPGSASPPEAVPVTGDTATAETPTAESAPGPRKSRRGLAIGVAGALVAIAAGGGIGFAVLQQQKNDDTPASAQPWKAPQPSKTGEYGTQSGGSHYGALGKLLLPMPAGYVPGPDMAEYGNDAEYTGKDAVAVFQGDYAGLSKKERAQVRKAVDAMHIQGVGFRSYRNTTGTLVVNMQIVQMKNKSIARAGTDFYSAFTKALGVFRNGPKIAGHDKARCVLPPKNPGAKLDAMSCQATEGDVMVRMTVTGTAPLQKDNAAYLFKEQLDRVQDPGEAA